MDLVDYDPQEEKMNYLSHGLGTVISIVGLYFLIKNGLHFEDNLLLGGLIVFGISLILTFLSSTLYHFVAITRLKKMFRLIDHSCIYLLIAGSYTPFMLGNLRPGWGIYLFFTIWTLAILGIVFKLLIRDHLDRFERIDLFLYIAIGGMAIFFIKPIMAAFSFWAMFLLLLGGAFYLTGTFFYSNKRIPFNHAIWHLFVMGGAACHYFTVLFYVHPPFYKEVLTLLG